jgi:hypothetical protein
VDPTGYAGDDAQSTSGGQLDHVHYKEVSKTQSGQVTVREYDGNKSGKGADAGKSGEAGNGAENIGSTASISGGGPTRQQGGTANQGSPTQTSQKSSGSSLLSPECHSCMGGLPGPVAVAQGLRDLLSGARYAGAELLDNIRDADPKDLALELLVAIEEFDWKRAGRALDLTMFVLSAGSGEPMGPGMGPELVPVGPSLGGGAVPGLRMPTLGLPGQFHAEGEKKDEKDETPKEKQRQTNPSKAESPIWREAKPFKDGLRRQGKEIWDWDKLHNDIEVYDTRGRHLGSRNPTTGEMYKGPVKGRTIDL